MLTSYWRFENKNIIILTKSKNIQWLQIDVIKLGQLVRILFSSKDNGMDGELEIKYTDIYKIDKRTCENYNFQIYSSYPSSRGNQISLTKW